MRKIEKQFGFYPETLEVDTSAISIRPLPELDEVVNGVLSSEQVDDNWIYIPPRRTRDLMSGRIYERPFSARVFCLPKTHRLKIEKASGDGHAEFHLWVLSFFLGMRLTSTEAGFVDATPSKPGTLVDFLLGSQSLEQAIELGEAFWMAHRGEPRNARRFAAAIHALFLAQYPQSFQYESFIHLYTAIDACYALTKSLRSAHEILGHAERIGWMCRELDVATPPWVETAGGGGSMVSAVRNDSLHEALFMGEPFGFAAHRGRATENITLEMEALVCRLLVALIGGMDSSYLRSPVNTRQRFDLCLN